MKTVLSVFLCLLFSSWCVGAEPGGANFLLETTTEGLARAEVRVTGAELKEPVTQTLEAKEGAISEWIRIPPGDSRIVEVVLFGANGEMLASGKAIENIADKRAATLLLRAQAVKDGASITVVLSTQKLTLTPLDKPRKDGKLGVQARLFDAQGKELPIRKGMLTWVDVNNPVPNDGGFDPRNPGLGYFNPVIEARDKYKLNVCACLIGQPCRCVAPPPPPMRYIDVSAGGLHSCAIDQNNHAFCWGANVSGQLGTTTTAQCIESQPPIPPITRSCSVVPLPVSGAALFTQISAGGEHTCAVDTTGDVWCWGRNNFGQLGTGAVSTPFVAQAAPLRVNAGATKFKEVAAGKFHTCALGTDNLVQCWGKTDCGQAGPTPAVSLPRPISTTQTFKALSAGANHNCALSTNGQPMCWGSNFGGQLGFTGPISVCGGGSATPQLATHSPAVFNPSRIAAGGSSSCVGSSTGYGVIDGSITCWGVLANAPQTGAQKFITTTVMMSIGGDDLTSDHICALNPSGTAHCWGQNLRGLLGVGSMLDPVPTPAFVQPSSVLYRDLDSGTFHNCAINSKSEVECWGMNHVGQLGNATQTESSQPVHALLFYLPPATLVIDKTVFRRP